MDFLVGYGVAAGDAVLGDGDYLACCVIGVIVHEVGRAIDRGRHLRPLAGRVVLIIEHDRGPAHARFRRVDRIVKEHTKYAADAYFTRTSAAFLLLCGTRTSKAP